MNIESLIHLWNITQQQRGTSGARVAAGVLLGLYNGYRFPFDLTELRALDHDNLQHAINVIKCDAECCQMEVHAYLDRVTKRSDFGERFEHLAYDFEAFRHGRCEEKHLRRVVPATLVLKMPESAASGQRPAASGQRPAASGERIDQELQDPEIRDYVRAALTHGGLLSE